MKVIYLGHHALGDAVMKIPAIRYLLNKFGQEDVFLTVRDENIKNFLVEHTGLNRDNLIIYNKNLSLKSKLIFLKKLRELKLKYFILPPTIDKKKGKVLFILSRAQTLIAHYQIYQKPKWNEVCIHKFKHKLLQNLEFIRFFESWSDKRFYQFAEENYFLDNLIDVDTKHINLKEKYILIHPGSGGNYHKRYPVDKWQDLVISIRKSHPEYKIYISGFGNDEKDIADRILAPLLIDNSVTSIVNKHNLAQTITIIRNCNLFISADCGPSHLASIMKKKMVAIFGPTDFDITGPFSCSISVRPNPKLICMPDYLRKKYGNRGYKLDCFQSISNSQVLKAINHTLKKK